MSLPLSLPFSFWFWILPVFVATFLFLFDNCLDSLCRCLFLQIDWVAELHFMHIVSSGVSWVLGLEKWGPQLSGFIFHGHSFTHHCSRGSLSLLPLSSFCYLLYCLTPGSLLRLGNEDGFFCKLNNPSFALLSINGKTQCRFPTYSFNNNENWFGYFKYLIIFVKKIFAIS